MNIETSVKYHNYNIVDVFSDFINDVQSTIENKLKSLWCESAKVIVEIHKQKYGYNYLLIKVDNNKIASLHFNTYNFNKEFVKNNILDIIFGDEK